MSATKKAGKFQLFYGTYVFEPNGEIMTTDSFNRRLKKYCKEAQPHFTTCVMSIKERMTDLLFKNLVFHPKVFKGVQTF